MYEIFIRQTRAVIKSAFLTGLDKSMYIQCKTVTLVSWIVLAPKPRLLVWPGFEPQPGENFLTILFNNFTKQTLAQINDVNKNGQKRNRTL